MPCRCTHLPLRNGGKRTAKPEIPRHAWVDQKLESHKNLRVAQHWHSTRHSRITCPAMSILCVQAGTWSIRLCKGPDRTAITWGTGGCSSWRWLRAASMTTTGIGKSLRFCSCLSLYPRDQGIEITPCCQSKQCTITGPCPTHLWDRTDLKRFRERCCQPPGYGLIRQKPHSHHLQALP